MSMKRFIVIGLFILTSFQMALAQDYYTVRRSRISTNIHQERAPRPLGDSLLFYISTRSVNAAKLNLDQNGNDFFYMFVANVNERNFGGGKEVIFETKNELGAGPPSFAKNGNLMVFPQYYSGTRIGAKSIGLFFADRDGDKWVNVRPFEYNNPDYVLYTPCITEDGKTLYFSANYSDAIGGYDIYASYLKNDRWSAPENLGRAINTEYTEFYPFYHPIGRLYFTSDGFESRGGYDIFQSDFHDGEWMPAEKIPFSRINSPNDDYALVMADNFESGYFERRGATYDIYEFTTDIPVFTEPEMFRSNYHRRFLLKDNSLEKDTIDPELFEVAWIVDDTIRLPGSEVIYAFPGPGTYNVRFEVYDILLDSVRVILDKKQVVSYRTQAAISCPDTVMANTVFRLHARETYLPDINIDQYYWDFGDGLKDEGIETSHTYKYPGTYRIVLGVKERVEGRREVAELH
ncbi:MAG TPA: PKD domain-containing protein, partial [Bacteroidaceae bacterium]|nr:PKD domain-containing protein [Bacteroidaceae bacterium]